MTRIALTAVALVVLWVLLLGAAAGIPLSAPLFAQRQIVLNGQDFRPVMGAGVEDGSALGIGAIASDGNAMQSIPLERIRAADHRLLTYHFEDFPRTLELLLVFRRAEGRRFKNGATARRLPRARPLPPWRSMASLLGRCARQTN